MRWIERVVYKLVELSLSLSANIEKELPEKEKQNGCVKVA